MLNTHTEWRRGIVWGSSAVPPLVLSTGLRWSEPLIRWAITQDGRPPSSADDTRSAEAILASKSTMYVRATARATSQSTDPGFCKIINYIPVWIVQIAATSPISLSPQPMSNFKLVNNLGHEIPSVFLQFLLGVSPQNVSLSSLFMLIISVGEVKGLVFWFSFLSKSNHGQIKRYRVVTKCSWSCKRIKNFLEPEKRKMVLLLYVLCAVEGDVLRW